MVEKITEPIRLAIYTFCPWDKLHVLQARHRVQVSHAAFYKNETILIRILTYIFVSFIRKFLLI